MSSSVPISRFPALRFGREQELAIERSQCATQDPSDEALIARVRADDSEALGLLFRRYCRLVWTIAERILRNKEEADDLVQDVFLLVRRRASVFDPAKGPVRSLLVQMSYQRAFSRRRDLMRRHFYNLVDGMDVGPIPRQASIAPPYDEGLEAHFGREALQRALTALSFEQREALRLCFALGYSMEEIASQLGCSAGNARHHYYRGLAKLRKELLGK